MAKSAGYGKNDERREKIKNLRKEGKRIREISEALGISDGTTSYYLNMLGLSGKSRKSGKIAPIVYRAEQNGSELDQLFSELSTENKVAALKSVIERSK